VALAYVGLFAVAKGSFLNPDVYAYAFTARRWLEGNRLYGLAWENKPPLAILAYVPATLFGRDVTLASQVMHAAMLLLGAALAIRLLRPYGTAARLAAAASVLLWPLQRHEFFWYSSEEIANFPVLLVLLTAIRLRDDEAPAPWLAWLHGLMFVAAFQVRQNTAVFGAVSLIVLLSGRRPPGQRLRMLGGMVGGGLVMAGLVAGLVLAACDPRGYWDACFEAPRRFGGSLTDAANLAWAFRNDALLLALVTATVAVSLRRRAVFPLVWLALAVLSVFSPKRPYEHYCAQFMPVAAVLQALAAQGAATLARQDPKARRIVLGFTLGIAAYFTGNALLTVAGLPFRMSLGPLRAVAESIDRQAGPNDRLFTMGRGDMYITSVSRLQPYDRFHWGEHLTDAIIPALPEPIDRILERIRANPPEWVALDAIESDSVRGFARGEVTYDPTLYGLIDGWIGAGGGYREAERVGDWVVYRKATAPTPARRDPGRPAPPAPKSAPAPPVPVPVPAR
jgi:hypothetical protein